MGYQLFERIAQGFAPGEPAVLRVRIFRLVTALTAALCLLMIVPMNLVQQLPLGVHLSNVLLGLLGAFFYWQSCRGRTYLLAFVITALLLLDFIWFLNAGSRGSITYFFFPVLLLTVGTFHGRAGRLFIVTQVVNVLGLFALGYYFPSLVTPFQSDTDLILDHVTSCFAACVATIAIAAIILRDYHREQRRLAEVAAQLAASELKLRVIFNSTSDALFVHAADGRPLDLNERACTLFGFEHETGLRLRFNDCSLGVSPYSEVEAREKRMLALQGSPQVFEWRSRRYNGELFWSEVALRAGDFAGQRCVIAAVRDISSRKLAQLELLANEERLRLAMLATRQGWFELNLLTGRGIASEEYVRIIGYEPENFSTTVETWLEAVHPEDRASVSREFRECVQTGETRSMEYRRQTRTGEWKWIRSVGRIVERDATGRPVRMMGTHADITARKDLERQLLHSQRLEAVGTLASGVAHDLNNILTPMLMASGLLRESLGNPADRELMVMIEKGGQRGAVIVRQLLDFSRTMRAERCPITPGALLQEVAGLLRPTLPKEIVLVESAADGLHKFEGDAMQMRQVLLQLCANAREAMPEGGTLTLGFETVVLPANGGNGDEKPRSGPHLVLLVSDTGCGIAPEIKSKIFDPFFTTKAPGKGTGLGLASVHGIVTSHRGFIRFESTVGRGTTFRVFLPEIYTDSGTPLPVVLGIAADLLRPALPVAPVVPTAKSASLVSPKPLSATAAPICILVVDDEAMVATTTVRLLNKNGFAAISVSGGVEALQILRERRQEIGLVLTDFMMPDMDGPTLLPLLRQIVPNLKVIGVSGHDKRASGLELGFDAILTKPYDLPAMLATIRRVIAQA